MTLQYGSEGQEVRRLQEALNQKGYALDTDGVFGNKTLAAVKDYQSKNGLTADGVAGDEVLGLLGTNVKSSPLTGVSDGTAARLAALEGGYEPSTEVKILKNKADTLYDNAPEAYVSPYESELDTTRKLLESRVKFNYNPNTDAAFGAYKELYRTLGKRAAEDAAGTASALTGGFANSYAVTAAEGAYDTYLAKLYDKLPELYQSSLSAFTAENENLRGLLDSLTAADNTAYARSRDAADDYNDRLNLVYDNYTKLWDADLDEFRTMLGYWQNKAEAEQAQENYVNQLAAQYSYSGGSSSGGSSRSSGGSSKSSSKSAKSGGYSNGLTASDLDKAAKSLVESQSASGSGYMLCDSQSLDKYVAQNITAGASGDAAQISAAFKASYEKYLKNAGVKYTYSQKAK